MVRKGKIDSAVDTRPYYRKLFQEALLVGNFKLKQIEDWWPKDGWDGVLVILHRDGRKFEYYENTGLLRQIENWRQSSTSKIYRNPVFIFREDSFRKIYDTMEILGISQRELARRTGISQSSINKYILGTRAPRISAGEKICKELKLDIHELYDEIDEYGNYVYQEPDHTFDYYADYGDDENEEDNEDWEDE